MRKEPQEILQVHPSRKVGSTVLSTVGRRLYLHFRYSSSTVGSKVCATAGSTVFSTVGSTAGSTAVVDCTLTWLCSKFRRRFCSRFDSRLCSTFHSTFSHRGRRARPCRKTRGGRSRLSSRSAKTATERKLCRHTCSPGWRCPSLFTRQFVVSDFGVSFFLQSFCILNEQCSATCHRFPSSPSSFPPVISMIYAHGVP